MGEDIKQILITGFGPYDIGFDKAEVNPSWEGVKKINKDEIESKHGVKLTLVHLPVDYAEVDAKIMELWNENKFDIAIHVGLSKEADCLKLEKQACKASYFLGDCRGCLPPDYQHPVGEQEVMDTALDVDAILEQFNADPPEQLSAVSSEDAGKFLCEYVYYHSLHHSETKKVLFVHVPNENYSHEQIARGIERLLELILNHS